MTALMIYSCYKLAIWATFASFLYHKTSSFSSKIPILLNRNRGLPLNNLASRGESDGYYDDDNENEYEDADEYENVLETTYAARHRLEDLWTNEDFEDYYFDDYKFDDDDDEDDEGQEYNYEEAQAAYAARHRLDGLWTDTNTTVDRSKYKRPENYYANPSVDSNSVLHPDNIQCELFNPPPRTARDHVRLAAEIKYLESLADSDDALTALWNLWFSERGIDAATELEELEAVVIHGSIEDGWPEAEERLRDIIDEEGVHWPEPINLLATLLRQQARYQEAKELYEIVRAVKGWHFGAVRDVVRCYKVLGDDDSAQAVANAWALPPLEEGLECRKQWVKKAVVAARANWAMFGFFRKIFIEGHVESTDDEKFDDTRTWQ